jgi:transglutaminase-like putative cysteine protease
VQQFSYARAVGGQAPLLSIYAPTAMTLDATADVLYDPRRQTLRTTRETRRLVGYTIRAQTDPSVSTQRALTDHIVPAGGGSDWFDDRNQPDIRNSDAEPLDRVRDLARQLLIAAGMPERTPSFNNADRYSNAWDWNRRAAQVFVDYLQSSDFQYSLDLSHIRLGRLDPVIDFLFNHKRGHCEYFASALTAMCQSVSIPARVVVGYLAQDYDEEGNSHAWVEVAVGPHKWKEFDGTPPAGLPVLSESEGTLAGAMRSVYSRFEGNWSTQVVGFDTGAQERLIDTLSRGWTQRLTTILGGIRQGMQNVNDFFNVGPGGYIWMGIVALALTIAVIALLRLLRRSRAIRRTLNLQHLRGAEYRRMLTQLGFYLDMLGVLERGGLGKPQWRPPMLHAAAIAGHAPEPA